MSLVKKLAVELIRVVIWLSCRNSQRLLHIPFLPPCGMMNQASEDALREARESASSSIGILIGIGKFLQSPEFSRDILEQVMVYIQDCLPGLHRRVHKSYALLLSVARLVCTRENFYA